jgi:decaprenylphospho-beta-D-erythro-pentofuranosid-2-ulose 2-reductase
MQDALGAARSMLVLGGTSEIALATVRRLAQDRLERVVLAARDADAAAAAATPLRDLGLDVATTHFDALQTDQHVDQVNDAFEALGEVDVVLHAAGVLGDQGDFDADPGSAARAATANYGGAMSALLAVAERLRSQGHGSIVVLSSVAAERPRRSNFVYGSTKAGLDAFAQGLGDSLLEHGILVMVVRPGFVHTRMTRGMDAQPFSTSPEAVADAIARGLARRDELVWVPSVLRYLFIVMRHLPRGLWRRVSAR